MWPSLDRGTVDDAGGTRRAATRVVPHHWCITQPRWAALIARNTIGHTCARARRKPPQTRTVVLKARFLVVLAQRDMIRHACEVTKISRSLVYYWKVHDPKFAQQ